MTKATRTAPATFDRFAALALAHRSVVRQIDLILIEGRGRIGALPALIARRDAIIAEASMIERHQGPSDDSAQDEAATAAFYDAIGIVRQ